MFVHSLTPNTSSHPPPFSILLALQFGQYAKGLPTISEEDFAGILLKHTRARMSEISERLLERTAPDSKVGWTRH